MQVQAKLMCSNPRARRVGSGASVVASTWADDTSEPSSVHCTEGARLWPPERTVLQVYSYAHPRRHDVFWHCSAATRGVPWHQSLLASAAAVGWLILRIDRHLRQGRQVHVHIHNLHNTALAIVNLGSTAPASQYVSLQSVEPSCPSAQCAGICADGQ